MLRKQKHQSEMSQVGQILLIIRTNCFSLACSSPHLILLKTYVGQWKTSKLSLWRPLRLPTALISFLLRYVQHTLSFHARFIFSCRPCLEGWFWEAKIQDTRYSRDTLCSETRKHYIPELQSPSSLSSRQREEVNPITFEELAARASIAMRTSSDECLWSYQRCWNCLTPCSQASSWKTNTFLASLYHLSNSFSHVGVPVATLIFIHRFL